LFELKIVVGQLESLRVSDKNTSQFEKKMASKKWLKFQFPEWEKKMQ
jgi:hypothetical protein